MTNPVTIGDATLHLGDCREIVPSLIADAVFADPPYLEGDQSDMLLPLLSASKRVVVTPGKLESFNWIARSAPTWEYAWQSATKTLGGAACFHIGWEPMLAWGYPKRPLANDLINVPIQSGKDKPNHPWPKPIVLMERIVLHWSDEGETVLDPFMGSATTGVACAKLGRKFIGIEINPEYFEEACWRVEEAQRQRIFT